MDEKEVLEHIRQAKEEGATELDLPDANLASIPPEIGHLTRLQLLSLASNQLTAIPETLGQLTELVKLDLSGNQLTAIPEALGQLTNLERLDLDGNQLTGLPRSLGQLTNLQTLHLHSNQLTSIPDWLGQLTNLRRFTLSSNQLTSIPQSLGQLTNLEELYLHYNPLTSIPQSLGQLARLGVLTLAHNQLTSLPQSLGRLTNLEYLYLHNNRLTTIPQSLGQLANLQELSLFDNPLESPPPEVVKQGTKAVLAYLRELAKGTKRRYEAKLLILGDGDEGKTCVSRALRGLPFKHQVRTPGVEVHPWTFENAQAPEDERKKITLHIWDFEGQEINHQSHQFFLTAKSLYLLVINGRREFKMERAEYWLDTIRARAPGSRVILVASECEGTTPSWPLDKLRASYGDLLRGERWYFVVGCETGKGIDELTQEIQSAAAAMDVMGSEWPVTYGQAEKAIERRRMKEAHVSRAQMYEIFAKSGISEDGFEEAAARLATLGLITQFRGAAELVDFVVLNPQWLTKGISLVMEDKQLEDDHGEISHERMRQIWEKDYPGLYPTFHNCMEGFELCYDMEDKAGSLVPLWFGDAVPEIPWSTRAATKERRVEYRLNIRPPKGLMSRFIVKTHHMIAKTKEMSKGVYWRNGVFLRTGEGEYTSEALCEFDHDERALRIRVRAAFPQMMIEQLHGFAKAVFEFFEGLEPERRYGCVKFEPVEEQCLGAHAEKRILFALSRNKNEIDCDTGWHVVNPRELVYGFCSFGEAAVTMKELRDELDRRPEWAKEIIGDIQSCLAWIDKTYETVLELRGGQKALSAELRQQIQLRMREYLRALSEMLDNRDFNSAPGVVAIVPADASAFNPRNWFEKGYVLTPYCESESGVHTVDFHVAFKKPRVWWEKTAPKLALGVKVLSAGLSIGFAGMPLAVGDQLYQTVKNEVAFMKELTKHLELEGGAASDVSDEAGDFIETGERGRRSRDLRDFGQEDQKRMARQQLARLLREIAPKNYEARQWGPLRRIRMPDNTYRWLCPQHAGEYR